MCDEYADDLIETQQKMIRFLEAEVDRLKELDIVREREYKLKMGMLEAMEQKYSGKKE